MFKFNQSPTSTATPLSYITDRLLMLGAENNGFYIVPLSKDDIPKILKMVEKDEELRIPFQRAVSEEFLNEALKYNTELSSPTLLKTEFWLVAREYKTGTTIGFIAYMLEEDKTLSINTLAVMEKYR